MKHQRNEVEDRREIECKKEEEELIIRERLVASNHPGQ